MFDCSPFLLRTEFGSRESSSSDKQLLTIYDLDNKFIAYSASFDDVIDVVAEWGSFYILTRDGKVFVLQEKDTQTKLEVSPEQESTTCGSFARLLWLPVTLTKNDMDLN